MREHPFKPGDGSLFEVTAPNGRFCAFFEDDGDTGYFFAIDDWRAGNPILDAVHIYDAANMAQSDQVAIAKIVWSPDGTKCALLINNYPHAVFDFSAQRGYCRTNFPNFPKQDEHSWDTTDHAWSDEAAAWLTPAHHS